MARAGENRYASADMLHREREQAIVFVIIERVRFAGRAGDDERLRARIDLEIEQRGERLQIERIAVERRG